LILKESLHSCALTSASEASFSFREFGLA